MVADVVSGKSADCRLQYRDCSPHDSGRLQIHVVDVLAVGDDAAFRRFGAAMKDSNFTEAPHEVRTTPVVTNQIVEVSVRISAPLDAPLTDAQVNERFRGKRLLLSLSFAAEYSRFSKTLLTKAVPRKVRLPGFPREVTYTRKFGLPSNVNGSRKPSLIATARTALKPSQSMAVQPSPTSRR